MYELKNELIIGGAVLVVLVVAFVFVVKEYKKHR